jgi:hypothetical protein
LQKQILFRSGLGTVFLVLLAPLIVVFRDIYLWAPCAVATVFFATSAFLMFRRAESGGYAVIDGKCIDVGAKAGRRHTKYLILQTDVCMLKVMLHNRTQKLPVGTAVRLYVAENTPVYERKGLQILYDYMAMDAKKVK